MSSSSVIRTGIDICMFSIGICRRVFGLLQKNNINCVLNVRPCDDSHSSDELGGPQKEFFSLMLHVIQLRLSYDGEIAIYCDRGRSRSPAVIAAYFVVIECLSSLGAYKYMSKGFF